MSASPEEVAPDYSGPQETSSRGSRLGLNETARQAGMLFSAHSVSMSAGFVIGLIQGRWMTPAELGKLAFCLSFVLITGLLFEFGLFAAGGRVLALTSGREREKQALGALILMASVVGFSFCLFILGAAPVVDRIFRTEVRSLLTSAAPLAFFYPFQLLTEQSCQGLNRIRHLSLFQALTPSLYLALLATLVITGRLHAQSALIAYLISMAVVSITTLFALGPRFANVRELTRLTLKEVRAYGLNIYLARITGTASARVDSLIIAYFLGRADQNLAPLGLYNFAQRLSNPILASARAVAVSRFRAFARLQQVPYRINMWNAILTGAGAVGLVVLGPPALAILFPNYVEAARLLLPFALASMLAGLFQPYNMFLASHGRGAELRNIAAAVGICSVAGLALTVPRLGVAGAAWTAAAAMALDYLLHLHYYRKYRKIIDSTT